MDLFLLLVVFSYVSLWAHFIYALIMGPVHQALSYRRAKARVAREVVRARLSPGGPMPDTPQEGPERLTMRTAILAWILCALATLALGILPYMILFADIGSVTPRPEKRSANWITLVEDFSQQYIVGHLDKVGVAGNIGLFIVINREILIMAGLAVFVRWPNFDPKLVRGNTITRKSAYNDEGMPADDTLNATLERHRSLKRAASQASRLTNDTRTRIARANSPEMAEVKQPASPTQEEKRRSRRLSRPLSQGVLDIEIERVTSQSKRSTKIASPIPQHSDDDSDSDEGLVMKKDKLIKLIFDKREIKAKRPPPLGILRVATAKPVGALFTIGDGGAVRASPSPVPSSGGKPGLRRGVSTPDLRLGLLGLSEPMPPIPVLAVDLKQLESPFPDIEVLQPEKQPADAENRRHGRIYKSNKVHSRSASLGDLTSWAQTQSLYSLPFKGLRHAIIIACHNSSEVLVGTLTRLLKLVEPRAVFLADNGSSEDEVIATKRVAEELSQTYKEKHPDYHGLPINVGVLKQGSKTIAQFSVLNSLAYLKSDIEFVSLLDDDTVFPDDWSEKYTLNMFDEQSDCHCLAYPIGAEKLPDMNLVGHFQDFEYRISMFTKIAQARITSSLFPSGAVSTWRAITLLDILSRHDTMFRGDDLQMGLLMHTLYKEIKFLNPEEVHVGNYAIRVAPFMIPTMVPIHWFHWKDLFPKVYWKKLPNCDCGEPSLCYQRARSWEVARHRFFGKFVRVCIHSQKMWHANTWFAKICALDAVIGVLNDWVQLSMVVFVLIFSRSGIVIGVLSLTSLAFQLLAFDLLSLLVLDSKAITEIPCEIRVLYPLCYTPILNILIKHGALVYNYFHYTPMVRNSPVIGAQARKEILDTMWTSWSPYAVVQEQWDVLRDVSQRIRDIEKSKPNMLRRLSSFASEKSGGKTRPGSLSEQPPMPPVPSLEATLYGRKESISTYRTALDVGGQEEEEDVGGPGSPMQYSPIPRRDSLSSYDTETRSMQYSPKSRPRNSLSSYNTDEESSSRASQNNLGERPSVESLLARKLPSSYEGER
ncbi:hypothetical protein HDU87_008577 [Geranomyces variabilis]|uniref:Glycosyltransferase 2-like domain-containing protein n=1 Tax=Geranomyces variabilis TaxID=109894 RepID=A0AAD5TPF6_9FUNG|nr:hypothetical protein HDU87_008577 [Geranomyces variabilis]